MARVLDVAERVAASRAGVVVEGESGTGKELVARFIHDAGPWRSEPFVGVNCAALPAELMESELFGNERGAFTGAHHSRTGRFEQAKKGTILLDDVSEIPLPLQAKLLRVLQEREIDRLGATRPIPFEARVIATTNRDLRQLVQKGKFRLDLYYRLAVVPIRIPPLRERPEDVEAIIASLWKDLVFDYAAIQALREYRWPGNVRELENVLTRASLLAVSKIMTSDLDLDPPTDDEPERTLVGRSIADVERELILATMKEVDTRAKAAEMLGIGLRTLQNKLVSYRHKEAA